MNGLMDGEQDKDLHWHQKCWGWTACVVVSPLYSKHKLKVSRGGYCSWHFHENRGNRFIVDSGVVEVAWLEGLRFRSEVLYPGSRIDVPSRVIHQFRVHSSGVMFEEYWPDGGREIDCNDIERLMVGGTAEPRDFPKLYPKLLRKVIAEYEGTAKD